MNMRYDLNVITKKEHRKKERFNGLYLVSKFSMEGFLDELLLIVSSGPLVHLRGDRDWESGLEITRVER